ncbi:hypothetical protein P4C99_15565 [Pontiellaceae bacterium B1224]|nr:hypothetical protein [Pontiellaceae bacterium B1224]
MKGLMIGVVLFLVGSALAVESYQPKESSSAYRAFEAQGRAIEARVVKVDVSRGTVTLELANKQRKKVKISIFSKGDQAYILECAMVQEFKSSRFKMEFKKELIDKTRTEPSTGIRRDTEKFQYDIKIVNGTALKMEGITLSYNIFLEQEELADGKNDVNRYYVSGEIPLKPLAPKAKVALSTKTFSIYSQKLAGGYSGYSSGAPTHQSGKSKGAWLRLTLKTRSGLTAMKEACLPKNTNEIFSWQEVEKE